MPRLRATRIAATAPLEYGGRSFRADDVIEVTSEDAKKLIGAGKARPVTDDEIVKHRGYLRRDMRAQK